MPSAKQKISQAFDFTLGPKTGLQVSLAGVVASKLYEARVLAELLVLLQSDGYKFEVENGTVGLKASPGPINPAYAYIQVFDQSNQHIANIWTDVEFVTLSSHALPGNALPSTTGEYHELDIVVCDPKLISGRPNPSQVYVGVEAKHWQKIHKRLLREILGVRRELSILNPPIGNKNPISSTTFRQISNSTFDSFLLFAFSTPYPPNTGPVTEWNIPAEKFDLELWHVPI